MMQRMHPVVPVRAAMQVAVRSPLPVPVHLAVALQPEGSRTGTGKLAPASLLSCHLRPLSSGGPVSQTSGKSGSDIQFMNLCGALPGLTSPLENLTRTGSPGPGNAELQVQVFVLALLCVGRARPRALGVSSTVGPSQFYVVVR